MSTRNMPARSTRGKRMNQLVGDDALVDEEFWKMDMFNEDGEDEEYKSEADEEDIIDADFDNPEEAESEEEVEVDKEKKEKKKMAYIDPKSKKAPKKRKVNDAKNTQKETQDSTEHTEVDVDVDIDSDEENKRATRRKKHKPKPINVDQDEQASSAPSTPSTPNTPSSTRKSTRAVALQRAAEREKERVETEKKRSLRPKKKSPVLVRRITQEELLEEAKITEVFNTESLKYILSMEEEKKRVKEAPAIIGPVIKYYSKDGKTCICFDELPDVLLQKSTASAPSSSSPEPSQPATPTIQSAFPTIQPAAIVEEDTSSSAPSNCKPMCPITGLPAKYKDPKTGICYANMEAFKTLRTNLLQKEEAEYNSKISELAVQLQAIKRKKDELQHTPTVLWHDN